jgi:predicted Zn-ribbon and HTH transcriptional regulator
MKLKLNTVRCLKCGYQWVPRKTEIRQCPKCKTAWFDRKVVKREPKN